MHSGDFTSTGTQAECQKFHDFVASLPHVHKIIIAGNHDITLDQAYYTASGQERFHGRSPQDHNACRRILTDSKDLIYLEDNGITIQGLNFWGSPWQPEFCDWAFNRTRGPSIKEKWDLIPEGVDILITHGPPYQQGDQCEDGFQAGCVDLLEAIDRINPLAHIFGHIHEAYGVTMRNTTTFINASTCTFFYRPTNPCIVMDVAVG